MHFLKNLLRSTAPGGRTERFRAGTPGKETGSKPPSVNLSAARTATACNASRLVTWQFSFLLEQASFLSKHLRHSPQFLPTLSRYREYFAKRLRTVPSGHIQLHQNRPSEKALRIRITEKTASPGTKKVHALPKMDQGSIIEAIPVRPTEIKRTKTEKTDHLTTR
jgi:hypothetical protein